MSPTTRDGVERVAVGDGQRRRRRSRARRARAATSRAAFSTSAREANSGSSAAAKSRLCSDDDAQPSRMTHPKASRRRTRRSERTGRYSTDGERKSNGCSTAQRGRSRANASAKRGGDVGQRRRSARLSAAIDVTRMSRRPQGTIRSNGVERGRDVERQAVDGDAPVHVHADGGELARRPTQTPGQSRSKRASTPKRGGDRDRPPRPARSTCATTPSRGARPDRRPAGRGRGR